MHRIVPFLLLYVQLLPVTTHDILVLQPFGSKSHRYVLIPIITRLGQHGHQVTYVSTYKFQDTIPPNITEIVYPQFATNFKVLQKIAIDLSKHGWGPGIIGRYYNYHSNLCHQFFKSQLLQNWIASGKWFKLVILDSAMHECILPLWTLLGQNMILMNTGHIHPWVRDYMNVPTPYAYVPFISTPYTPNMSFFERLRNSVYWILSKYVIHLGEDTFHKNLILPYFPNSQSHKETLKSISLVLVNADVVTNPPNPTLPTIAYIGGIQCRPPLPLPDGELKNFVDGADENGFILFSFGSIINGNLIDEKLRNAFISAFAQVKQRIVWKYESDLPGLSNNVMKADWLPQQDLLGHPKIRAFISHGGLQSLQESIYHAVPSICFPFTTDQPSLVEITSGYGIVIKLDPHSVTVEEIVNAINKASEDKEMRKAVQRYSDIFRDKEADPLDKAVFWIEYVMRHNGAMHLQTAAGHLNFFQYHLLDVSAFAAVILILFVSINYFAMKRLIQTCYPILINRLQQLTFKIKIS